MNEFKLNCNGLELNAYEWTDAQEPKAVVQLVHGMAEHAMRYNRFAEFLNAHGYIVIADDHRAHGKSAAVLGVTPAGDCFKDTVDDLTLITDYAKTKFNLPVVLFGHSYGSFLAQSYIQKFGDKIIGVVLCGTACQNTLLVKLGRIIASAHQGMFGKDKEAKFINNLTFGAYDKKFKSERKQFGWVTSDKEELERYIEDPMCGYVMSIGFFKSFFDGLCSLYTKKGLAAIRRDLPVLIIGGAHDPVGGDGKLIGRLKDMYLKEGLSNVQYKLYEQGRHEIINEVNREEVFADILSFIEGCYVSNYIQTLA